MEAQIKGRWDGLEERRAALVQRVRDLPPDRQNARPDAGSFTPVELVMHMALSDEVAVERIRKRPPATQTDFRPRPTPIYKVVVDAMNAGRRVPAPGNMKPPAQVSLDEAAQKWATVRDQLKKYLEMASSSDTVIQRTFLFGRLSVSQVLSMMESHCNYHDRYFPG